ncbi:MAG: GNAT family N-acetyltransferase [Candidatus Obscuribacterales bacterium]|nr:GNAT family N-acetyltransferase [Candidatus Obscuribacterales bacterium]
MDQGMRGLNLKEVQLDAPVLKDYDAIKGEGPSNWSKRFDVSNWGLITARDNGVRIGGAVIAFNTKRLHLLNGRRDIALLWDIRISPEYRGRGVGALLFRATESWAIERECKQLKIETQNINLAACKFYSSQGCHLGAIDRFAYPNFPDEVQLLWYKNLS